MDEGIYLCTVAPLLYLLSDLLPPPPFPMYSIYRQTVCDCGWGGGVLKCPVDHILQEFYTLFLTRFRTYKISTPPQTKVTSKDDIKGIDRPFGGGVESILIRSILINWRLGYFFYLILKGLRHKISKKPVDAA